MSHLNLLYFDKFYKLHTAFNTYCKKIMNILAIFIILKISITKTISCSIDINC
jgi:hypothetical protein